MKNNIFKILLLLVLASPLLFFGSTQNNEKSIGDVENSFSIKTVEADSGYELVGWAWSDNIGWVSFNCSNMSVCSTSNYSVVLDSSKDLTGYAWSDNIGWISFNEGDLSGCPSGTCKAWLDNSNNLKGWAKSLAGDEESDGWDGWISLDCSNAGECGTSNYGINLETDSSFSGYAWGSDVVGWLKFDSVSGDEVRIDSAEATPSVDISSSDNDIQSGESVTITWTSSNTEQCIGSCSGNDSCNFSPSGATSGSHNTVSLSEDTSYFVNCTNILDNSASDSVTVVVLSPEVDISINPSKGIKKGEKGLLSWSAQNVDTCEVSGPDGIISTSLSGSDVETNPIESNTTYTLSCVTEGGLTFSDSVTIKTLPVWEEF